ncbi:SGNH/GDSL hydrolase family protein [Saccharopolyspora karakumensis]|nr:SGNH/GDSL hydrolase family protein [Saccharopolyspora karakumensis]
MAGLRLPVLAGVGVMALLSAGVPAAAQEDAFEYVAMGDSAAAGPLVPGPDPHLLCFRSANNYPQVAAARLGAQLKDVTCSGAETEDFSGRQHHVLLPQYHALSETTDLVTVTIGGNDIALVQAAVSCLNAFPEPVGSSCADGFTANGDELAERIDEFTPDFDEALEEITDRAPHARVVVVGYGTYLPPGGCYPKQPMWARDADYIQSTVDQLSARLGDRARAHGATFVDLGPVSEGHDVCQAPQDKYFEGVVPTSWAAPLHPNANGMTAFGNAVADAVSEELPTRVRAAQAN